jgi:hypothetical protein
MMPSRSFIILITSGYPWLCRLFPTGSTSGLYPVRPLFGRLSLATRSAGFTDGLYPGRSLLHRPLPGPQHPAYTSGTLVARCFTGLSLPHPPCQARSGWTSWEHKTRCGSFLDLVSVSYVDWSKFKTPVIDRWTMQLISGPRFCQFLSLGCHLGGCRIGPAETVSVSFFRWVVIWGVAKSAPQKLFLSVSFVGLSSGGLQNRPRRNCFCQFLSLGCHLGGCRIGLAKTVNGSECHVTDRLSELIYRIP